MVEKLDIADVLKTDVDTADFDSIVQEAMALEHKEKYGEVPRVYSGAEK
jgi:hypothetical protein